MSGKLCFGSDYNNAGAGHLSASHAFCEGVQWRAKGTALAFPKTDNPHAAGEDKIAWDAGWDVAQAAAPGALLMKGTCCAAVPLIQA